jgi:hypothetical protein
MNHRIALATAILAAALLLCGLPVLTILAQAPQANACTSTATNNTPGTINTRGPGPVAAWNSTQTTNAAIIIAVGKNLPIPPRGWVIAVATAMTESRLTNSAVATDHDSVGLFQQRPSQGWGTVAQLTDPAYASRKFYEKLLTIPQWESLPVGKAAQAVQRSAFPDRYTKFEADAEQMVVAVTGVAAITDLPGASLVNCATKPTIAASGWTQPVKANITSGFRTADRPNHQGVDLGAPRNTVIRAASAGRIVWAGCDPTTGTCDIDGSINTAGCGWYVEIQHAANVATRYCHMIRKPEVTTGQNHCDINTTNAIDPVPYMQNVGAPLGHVS